MTEQKPMTVEGTEVPRSVLQGINSAMRAERGFTATELTAKATVLLKEAGIKPETVSDHLPMRIADRVIQQQRKAGKIRIIRGQGRPYWRWSDGAD